MAEVELDAADGAVGSNPANAPPVIVVVPEEEEDFDIGEIQMHDGMDPGSAALRLLGVVCGHRELCILC